MIKEIVNYAKWLKRDFPDIFEGNISEGLHIMIDLDDEGQVIENSYKSEKFEKNSTPSKFLNELKKREIISNALGDNKGIIDKVIFSNNPYAIFFKLYFTDSKNKNKVLNKSKFKDFSEEMFEKYQNNEIELNEIKKKLFENFITPRLSISINGSDEEKKSIKAYYEKIRNLYLDIEENSIEKKYINSIEDYVTQRLMIMIIEDSNFEKMFIYEEEKDNERKLILDDTFYDKQIKVNFNVPFEILQKASNRYLSKNIFNIAKYNFDYNDSEYGLSNFYNKAAEDKKLFNLHRSSFFKSNLLLERSNGILLNEFLNATDFLPKILPIFIDKEELNFKVIKLFNKEDKKRGYKEIISDFAYDNEEDLQNYYLLNFSKNEIKDMDFVSSFKFKQNVIWSKQLISLFFLKLPKNSILHFAEQNIFFIEKLIKEYFFYKKLSYFGTIKKTEQTPDCLIKNYYKYNELLYSAFYKSRLHLITANIFKDICIPIILYEISHDEINNKGKSKNEFSIIQKLLIYIQLNKLFDKENKNLGGIDMSSELPKYYGNCLKLIKGEIDHYQSDQDFAFGTGQLIRYLLEQSESSNKNHSMFIPFLQKLGNYDVFITQINRTMMTYGHKIKMHYDTFDKLMSNTTSYKLGNGKSLKGLETMIICGYFAKSAIEEVIKAKQEKKENKNSKGE